MPLRVNSTNKAAYLLDKNIILSVEGKKKANGGRGGGQTEGWNSMQQNVI